MRIYLRLLSIAYFIGFELHLLDFFGLRLQLSEMSVVWKAWIIYLLVFDAVAAIGLWQRKFFGVICFVIVAVSQLIAYTIFRSVFGDQTPLLVFHVFTLCLYAALGMRHRSVTKAANSQVQGDQKRPDFIKHWSEIISADDSTYPGSDELLSYGAALGKATGLQRIGLHHEILKPGRRTSWPHAESTEEEFAYIISGHPSAWINGILYALRPGDAVGFAAGTGIAHTFINNSSEDCVILVGGESRRRDNKYIYPLNPKRNVEIGDSLWKDCPPQALGPHDGLPDLMREKLGL